MKTIDSMTLMKIGNFANKNRIYNMNDYQQIISCAPKDKKYSDNDYLGYFVSKAFEIISKDGKVNINSFTRYFSLAAVFANAISVSNGEVEDEIKQKLFQIVPLFNLKVEQGIIEKNDLLVQRMNAVCEQFVGKRDDDFSSKSEAMYIQELTSSESKIKSQSAKIEAQEKQLEILRNAVSKLQSQLSGSSDKLKSSEKEIEFLNKLISDLEIKLRKASEDNSTLSAKIVSISSLYDGEKLQIDDLQKKVDELVKKLDEATTKNESYSSTLIESKKEKNQNEFIDTFVLDTILTGKMTVDELRSALCTCGHSVSKDDIIASLHRLQDERGIKVSDERNVTIPKYYHVSTPFLPTNRILNLDVKPNSCLDLMITSDYHVKYGDEQFVRIINLVYDYCSKNGIGTIINLGDLMYSFDRDAHLSSETFDENERLMDYIVKNIPHDDGIAHVILGGNHDREHSKLGVDPVSYITKNRDDMYNLGYDNATIKFKSNDFDSDFMMIHHAGLPREDGFDDVKAYNEEAFATGVKLNKAANNDYERNLLDVYGHQHVGRLDTSNKYLVTPALTQNRGSNGAWHLKIYFDENKKVQYMIFIPLYFEKYVKKGYETVMQPNR